MMEWQFIGNFGDVNYLDFGGFFVLYDQKNDIYRAIATENLYQNDCSENPEKTHLEWVELSPQDVDEYWAEAKTITDLDYNNLTVHDRRARQIQDIYYYWGFYHLTGERPIIFNDFETLKNYLKFLNIPETEL